MPGLSGAILAIAALSAAAGLVWLLRPPLPRHLPIALCFLNLAVLIWLLHFGAYGDFDEQLVREIARVAIPLSGLGLAAALSFGRSRPWLEIVSRPWLLVVWVVGAVAAAYGTGRPDFASTWTGSTHVPVLILGPPAVWMLVGHMAVVVTMAVHLETTYRSAGRDDRALLRPVLAGFFLGLLGVLGAISISLLFSFFHGPGWLAAIMPLGVTAALAGLSGLDRRVASLSIHADRSIARRSASLFLAGAYVLLLGLDGEVARLTGWRLSAVAAGTLLLLALAGVLSFFLSNRAHKRFQAFVDRSFLLTHHDYRRGWMELSTRLSPGLKMRETVQAVAAAMQDAFSVREVSVFLKRLGAEVLDLEFSAGPGSGLTVLPDEPLVRRLVTTRQSLLLGDRSDDFESVPIVVENHHILARTGARVWVPLFCGEQFVGMIGLGPKLNDLRFTYDDLDFLDAMAPQLAAALWGARLTEASVVGGRLEVIQKLSGFVVQGLRDTATRVAASAALLASGPPDAETLRQARCALDKAAELAEQQARNWAALGQEPGRHVRPCSLEELVQSAVEEFEPNGKGSGRVRLELEAGLPRVRVDAEDMRQVIVCLLGNAAEATSEGGEVRILAHAAAQGPGRGETRGVVLSILDSGRGMTQEFQQRLLFRPFLTTTQGGLGLGLFHSRHVVESFGGTMHIESAPGEGTRVEIGLPAATE